MGITFRPLHPVFVAECSGVDIGLKLLPQDAAAIDEGMDRYAVLVFPGQRFDDDQQLAFGRNFGEVEETPTLVDQARRRLPNNRINDISNLVTVVQRADLAGAPEPVVSGRYRLGDVRHIVASPRLASELIGFTASVDPITGLTSFATAPLRTTAAGHDGDRPDVPGSASFRGR